MFGFLRNRGSVYGLPAELRQHPDADDLLVFGEKVGVVRHFSGHVPGVSAGSSVARYKGAVAITTSRVLATFPTGADPRLRAVDSPWDIPRGPGRVTISPDGLSVEISLSAVDQAFSGSMTLNYKHPISEDVLQKLPATQLWCSVDPVFVYRAAGVRPRT